ncbi:MAG TPA: 16S rRNA (adenine(1518)-N(6)/adenine(1519)-N(6))-dimethyltransferase RsmA [Planctomycetota bacterium]|nr:16S rRNA (adenine(1518)-N(6)/adenine(1519)-N(6))-dimethyltransferase RsmA [Planctomycetota bacterium]
MSASRPWSEVRAELSKAGFRPSRRLGQNFLSDANMLRAIARDSGVARGDFVLEVGPGPGTLTAELVALGARILAVEIDPRLCELAERSLQVAGDVRFLCADALAGKHELNPALVRALPVAGDWHVVSSLPYSAGTPLLALLARLANPPATMTVLLQRELARKIAARPGGKEWGALGVRLQLAYRVRKLRSIPPELFWPRPQVESELLRLERREDRPSRGDLPELDALLEGLFGQRRKTLGGRLAAILGSRAEAERLLADHGLSPAGRAETVDEGTWLALSRDPRWRARPT